MRCSVPLRITWTNCWCVILILQFTTMVHKVKIRGEIRCKRFALQNDKENLNSITTFESDLQEFTI